MNEYYYQQEYTQGSAISSEIVQLLKASFYERKNWDSEHRIEIGMKYDIVKVNLILNNNNIVCRNYESSKIHIHCSHSYHSATPCAKERFVLVNTVFFWTICRDVLYVN